MSAITLISAFVLGFGGSLHCLGMCGPLALSIPFRPGGRRGGLQITVFYLSKALAYGLIGLIFGLLGQGFRLMEWQQGLSVISGIMIILIVCLPVLKQGMGRFLFQGQFSRLYSRLRSDPRPYHFFLLGFLNGLLPCGLVYAALALSISTANWFGGFASMFLFGLGTSPALVLLVLFRNKMSMSFRRRFRPVSIVLSVAVGLLLILRGLNLGLPYISPEWKGEQVRNCCHKPT